MTAVISGPSGTLTPAISRVFDAPGLTNVFAGATVSCLWPTVSVFIRVLLCLRYSCRDRCEPPDERERPLGDLSPAGVDRKRVPAARHLDNLGHALVALLLFVGRVRDRPRDRMVRVGRDDQHRTTVRVRRLDLRL